MKIARIILKILIICNLVPSNAPMVFMQKSTCTDVDRNFVKVERCELRRNKEDALAFFANIKILQLPVDSFDFNIQLRYLSAKNATLLTNRTQNYCYLYKNRDKLLGYRFIVYLLGKYTNINHSCPFNHNVVINNFSLEKLSIPVPKGKYGIKVNCLVNSIKRFTWDLYVKST